MRRNVMAAAICVLGIGFAAVSMAGHPSELSSCGRCCKQPRPEDVRAYEVTMTGAEAAILIPKVEGPNGFILTDVFAVSGCRVFQDAGEGPVEILNAGSVQLHRLSPVPGFPLILGSTITVVGSQDDRATLIGYVY